MLKVPLEMPVPAAVPSVQIIRAVLREYHAATHTAEVEPVLGPASLVGEIPVLMSCLPALLTAGQDVAVLTWSDVGGLVLGPYGGVPPQSLWGDGSDGAISNLTDADAQATTIAQTAPVTLSHNRTIRAIGNITLSQAVTVGKQDGQARGSFPTTHGSPGIPLGGILATIGSKGIPRPIRPGGGTASLCGGILQLLSGGTVEIGGAITAQGANAASDGGGGGGLVVVVAKTSITDSSAIDVSAASGHATAAAKAGSGSYSGQPGGHAGFGGSGGGGGGDGAAGGKESGGAGGTGFLDGYRGGHVGPHQWGGGGGGCITEVGDMSLAGSIGADGGDNDFTAASDEKRSVGLPLTAATAGTDSDTGGGVGGAAGDNGGGGGGGGGHSPGGGRPGGNGGDAGSGGGGGGGGGGGRDGQVGGDGADGKLYMLSSKSVYAGLPGGEGGGGGGGTGRCGAGMSGAAQSSGGSGAAGLTPFEAGCGPGSGAVGANGAAGGTSTSAVGGVGGAGGDGGNGGGGAGLVLLIAPSITYSGTVTGRLVKIDGADALDFIRGYQVA